MSILYTPIILFFARIVNSARWKYNWVILVQGRPIRCLCLCPFVVNMRKLPVLER